MPIAVSPSTIPPTEPDLLYRVIGRPTQVRIEPARSDLNTDHVWIDVDSGSTGTIRMSVPTFSRKNLLAGYTPAIHLRQFRLPPPDPHPTPGIYPVARSNYADLETPNAPPIREMSRSEMEDLLLREGRSAALVEAVGHLYSRDHTGLHEIHSRRASCAVTRNVSDRDGWICFHHASHSLLLLIRFCGQV